MTNCLYPPAPSIIFMGQNRFVLYTYRVARMVRTVGYHPYWVYDPRRNFTIGICATHGAQDSSALLLESQSQPVKHNHNCGSLFSSPHNVKP